MSDLVDKSLIDDLKKFKPRLSDKSLEVYINNLYRLNDCKKVENLDFLKKKRTILNKIRILKKSTQRNYLSAIIAFLIPNATDDKMKSLFEFYDDLVRKFKNTVEEETKNGMRTEKEKSQNWLTWSKITQKFNEMKKSIDDLTVEEKSKNWVLVRDTLLLGLYVLQDPRRSLDYADMYFNDKSGEHNSYDVAKQQFIFNNYKTKKLYGKQVVPVSKELQDLLKIWIDVYPLEGDIDNKPILLSNRKAKLNLNSGITKLFNDLFKPHKISSTALRHIFLSFKEPELLEASETAKRMGHSLSAAVGYIRNS